MEKMKAVSLFASAGIAEFGFEKSNVDVVIANELLPVRMDVHKFWHPTTETVCGDITKNEIKNEIIKRCKKENVDFVFATPPCQGVSLIGKNKTNEQMLADDRNFLIFHTFDIIDEIDPKCVLIENVARFFKMKFLQEDEFRTIDEIIKKKYSDKYNLKFQVYNAKDFGVPQHRERAIIKMWKKGFEWEEPLKQNTINLKQAIGHLPSIESGEISGIKNHSARTHMKKHIECLKHTPTGHSAFENEFHYPKCEKTGRRLKGYAATYKRMDWDKPAPTITMRNDCISSQSNVHPGRLLEDGTYSDCRVLSMRELFILSSLDPDLDLPTCASDTQVRHMIGEAVPPKLIQEILGGLKNE